MIDKVTNGNTIIQFSKLEDFLLMRQFPVTQTDISRRSRDIGKKVSQSSVSGFFSGAGLPDRPVFKRIVKTIEGLENITIDFSGSPYESLQPAAQSTPVN